MGPDSINTRWNKPLDGGETAWTPTELAPLPEEHHAVGVTSERSLLVPNVARIAGRESQSLPRGAGRYLDYRTRRTSTQCP